MTEDTDPLEEVREERDRLMRLQGMALIRAALNDWENR